MTRPNYCVMCGARLEPDARFCTACGAKIGVAADPPAPAQDRAARAAPAPTTPRGRRFGKTVLFVVVGMVLALVAILSTLPPSQGPKREGEPRGPTVAGPSTPSAPPAPSGPTNPTGSKPPAPPPATSVPTPPTTTAPTKPRADLGWTDYTNDRYGLSVAYPSTSFTPGEAPPDHAGRNFDGTDGARFHVYSHANALDQSIEALLAEALEGVDPVAIREKNLGVDGFVIVVARPDEVLHTVMKTSEAGSVIHWLEIGYPPSLAAKYAPLATRMIESLKVGPPREAERRAATGAPARGKPTVTGGVVVEVPHEGWITTEPSPAFADLPALKPDMGSSPDSELGQLVFVCRKSTPSSAFFALVVAPRFAFSGTVAVRLAVEGAGRGGALDLTMKDLYGTRGGERPKLDWDATILFAPIAMEDLGELIRADALLVTAGGKTHRLIGGDTLRRAGGAFLAECGD